MMRTAILDLPKQFAFSPVVTGGRLRKYPRAAVIGMGGSRLPSEIALAWKPELPLSIWNDYGLPPLPPSSAQKTLFVAASYSGNTEEVLDVFAAAQEKKYPLAAVAVGGKLIALAKERGVPYVQIPDTGIQPRSALGFMLRAILSLMGKSKALRSLDHLKDDLAPATWEREGRHLAETLRGRVPIFYASRRNSALAANWKIIFNETGKIPAFWNVLPEMNHNEMTGFDIKPPVKTLSDRFFIVLLEDADDHPRIQLRMKTLDKLLRNRGLPATSVRVGGATREEVIFSSIILASWTALATAENYGLEPEQVPMVEEFKQLITQ